MLMCRDVVIAGSDYIDGNLGTKDKLSVGVHLVMCKNCRSFIKNLKASDQLLRAHAKYRIGYNYQKRLEGAIKQALKDES